MHECANESMNVSKMNEVVNESNKQMNECVNE
jgi:hypothetical protein